MGRWAWGPLVVAAYVASAQLGFLFAIPSGNVTVLWPPSGIALAAALGLAGHIGGAIWLGAFLANLWFFHQQGMLDRTAAVVAAAIATGSALQASLAAAWLRRWVPDLATADARATLRFGGIVGVCCVFAATVGVGALVAGGFLPWARAWDAWGTWWVGDACGILVVTPGVLYLARRDRTAEPYRAATFPLICLGVGIAVIAYFVVDSLERQRETAQFHVRAQAMATAVRRALVAGQHDVQSLAAFVESTPDALGPAFHTFTRPLLARDPAIEALSYVARVPAAERAAFERRLAVDTGVQRGITHRTDSGGLVATLPAAVHFPVMRIEPLAGHAVALGFDIRSEAVRRAAIDHLVHERAPATTGFIQLVQDRVAQPGFLVLWPVWARAPDGREGDLLGLASGVFRLPHLMRAALHPLGTGDVTVYVYEGSDDRARPTLSTATADAPAAGPRLGEWRPAEPHLREAIDLPGYLWTLVCAPVAGRPAAGGSLTPWLALAVLLAFTALIAAYLDARHKSRVALERTHEELLRVHANLREEFAQRQRADAEREAMAGALEKAQRLESVGRLAGGIAHDFNNLLTVVLSGSELRLQDPALRREDAETYEGILDAARRATALTRQLLAFSRRQVLQPIVLDVNLALRDLQRLIEKLAGPSVTVALDLQPDLGAVRVDTAQLDQVVLNLATNARAAMPTGGTLTLGTRDVQIEAPAQNGSPAPGPWVELCVTDTGVGMDAATQLPAFEPFFTTRAVGEGTGLGLATVHGIVVQSGGHVELHSEPGHGTTVRILLPRVFEAPAKPGRDSGVRPSAKVVERILVVEDEPALRSLFERVLARAGHMPVAVESAEAALALPVSPPFDMIVTDVVLPGIGGADLARRMRERQPGQRVLFVSGHSRDVLGDVGAFGADAAFLAKPFTPTQLVTAIVKLLAH